MTEAGWVRRTLGALMMIAGAALVVIAVWRHQRWQPDLWFTLTAVAGIAVVMAGGAVRGRA